MLPSVKCVKPKHALSLMSCDILDGGDIVMNEDEFRSEAFQRVYQYLRRYTAKTNLDTFSYAKGSVEDSPYDCLQIMLRYNVHFNYVATYVQVHLHVQWTLSLQGIVVSKIPHGQKSDTLSVFWTCSYSLVSNHTSAMKIL